LAAGIFPASKDRGGAPRAPQSEASAGPPERKSVSIGILLARLVALALCALGLGAIAAPVPSSKGYGLPQTDPAALTFIRAMGVRDLALGIILGALSKPGSRAGLTVAVAASSLVALGDFTLVAPSATPAARTALKVHGSGIIGLSLLVAILRTGR
jgi:hypothetical protein